MNSQLSDLIVASADDDIWVITPESLLCVQFTSPSYPIYLTTFTYYVDSVEPASEVQPYAIYDADAGEPPDIAGAVPLSDPFTETELNSFVDLDISGVPELATPLEAGDFYLCFKTMNLVFHKFGFDLDLYQGRSWIWYSDTSEWYNLEESLIFGQLMFRASVLAP